MKIELKPGDELKIGFEDTDGLFSVHFDTKEEPNRIVVRESAGLPGNVNGVAYGYLYVEQFNALKPGGSKAKSGLVCATPGCERPAGDRPCVCRKRLCGLCWVRSKEQGCLSHGGGQK